MKNIVISGANGLLGQELVHRLKENNKLFLIVKEGRKNIIHPNVIYCDGSLEDNFFANFLPKNVDVIFHLAQSSEFREFPEKSIAVFNVNTYSTLKLLEYARTSGCKNFIYASSGSVYQNNGTTDLTEQSSLNTDSENFYANSKICSELLIHSYRKFFNTVICRFFFIYGKNQNTTMLIPRLQHSILQGQEIKIEGDNGLIINPIYVSDAAIALEQLMNGNQNLVINIAGPQILSLLEIVRIMEKVISKNAILKILPSSGPVRLVANIEKMKALNIFPQIDFKKGFLNSCN